MIIFDYRIVALIEAGIYDFWIEESLYINNDALRRGLIEPIGHSDHSSDTKRLKFDHLFGIYIILTSGSILSIITFLGEIKLKDTNIMNEFFKICFSFSSS